MAHVNYKSTLYIRVADNCLISFKQFFSNTYYCKYIRREEYTFYTNHRFRQNVIAL